MSKDKETSNETTSISQLSISEPFSTKSIETEISYNKGSITSSKHDSINSTQSILSNSSAKINQNRTANQLDLSFANNNFVNNQNTSDSSSVW